VVCRRRTWAIARPNGSSRYGTYRLDYGETDTTAPNRQATLITNESTLIEVAFAASTALDRAGVVAVVCGGSAATFYCNTYQSLDVDFVLRFHTGPRTIDESLRSVGFERNVGGVFSHPNSIFTIEVPSGPIAVGRKLISHWNITRRGDEVLHVLLPEDVVCDRFLHYWAWKDRSARDVAIQMARCVSKLDWKLIEAWAADEMKFDPLYDRKTWNDFRLEIKPAATISTRPADAKGRRPQRRPT